MCCEARADTPRAHYAEVVCARFVGGRDELLTLGAEQCVRRWAPAPSQSTCEPSLEMALPQLVPTSNSGSGSRVQLFAVRCSSHRSDVLRYCAPPLAAPTPSGGSLGDSNAQTHTDADCRMQKEAQTHSSDAAGCSSQSPSRRARCPPASLLFVPSHNDVLVFDADCGEHLAALKAHVSDVRQCVWRERAQELVSLGNDRQLLLWTPRADRPVLDGGTCRAVSSSSSSDAGRAAPPPVYSNASRWTPSGADESASSANALRRSRSEAKRATVRLTSNKIARTANGARVDPHADTWSGSDDSDS